MFRKDALKIVLLLFSHRLVVQHLRYHIHNGRILCRFVNGSIIPIAIFVGVAGHQRLYALVLDTLFIYFALPTSTLQCYQVVSNESEAVSLQA